VDFGLANLNQHLHKKDDVQVDRTVDYAGLEKATNAVHGDIRSDIYFLGCVAYELLTGRSPLEKSKSAQDRMRSARFQKVPPMRPEEVAAPPSVFRLVESMMALDPLQRQQTPSQLLEAIRAVRRDLDGANARGKDPGSKSLFVVEKDQRLQDALRDKFKEQGYRVLMSGDPVRALDRFRQQPYDCLIMDVGTVEEEGLYVFDRIMDEAKNQSRRCAGVVILSEHQADWAGKLRKRTNAVALVRPVTVKQLRRQLEDLFAKEEMTT
jgi:serine/threonine protein kinase